MDGEAVSLREFLERVLREMDLRYEQRFTAQETANGAALAATEKALTAALSSADKSAAAALEANKVLAAKAEEFADQKLQTHNAIRPWVEGLINAQTARLGLLEARVARFENREEGVSMTTKILISLLGIFATAVSLYFAFKGH